MEDIAVGELRECPFCGYEKAGIQYHESKFLGQRSDGIKRIQFRVYGYCKKCKSRGKPITVVIDDVGAIGWFKRFQEKAFSQAMEMWNHRVEPSKLEVKRAIYNAGKPAGLNDEQFFAVLANVCFAVAKAYGEEIPKFVQRGRQEDEDY